VCFFTSRLYFERHEYEGILSFLGLASGEAVNGGAIKETSKDADTENHAHIASKKSCYSLTTKTLAFLQDWISARRKMQDWSTSPIGFIVAGKQLHGHHPFFTDPVVRARRVRKRSSWPRSQTSSRKTNMQMPTKSSFLMRSGMTGIRWIGAKGIAVAAVVCTSERMSRINVS